MRRKLSMFLPAVFLPLLALLWFMNSGATAQDEPAQLLSSDEGPAAAPEALIPEKYLPAPGAAIGSGLSTVYFSPQDSNSNNTVLFLYNTNAAVANVNIHGYGFDGATTISTTVGIPASGAVRISADTLVVAPAPPDSWQDNVAYVNFTDTTAYAAMHLPAGVKAEGWVVWNGTADFDPRLDVERLPLRFSIDPPSVFLPVVAQDGS